jgi:hypothetical protein
MASARAAFRRKPPPEQRRGAPVQSPAPHLPFAIPVGIGLSR